MATGRRVTVYNPLLCERVATLAEATDPIQGICATMPGLLVTSDTGGHVRVFDSTCHELLQTIQLVPSGMLPPLITLITLMSSYRPFSWYLQACFFAACRPNYPNYPNERSHEAILTVCLPGTFRHASSRRVAHVASYAPRRRFAALCGRGCVMASDGLELPLIASDGS